MEKKDKNAVSEERILEELAAIGFARICDFVKVEDGAIVLKNTRQKAAVASIERTSAGLKVKLYDKLKALELLGKHIGMFDSSQKRQSAGNELLKAFLESTGKEVLTDDIPELQQAADAGDELVEQTPAEQL